MEALARLQPQVRLDLEDRRRRGGDRHLDHDVIRGADEVAPIDPVDVSLSLSERRAGSVHASPELAVLAVENDCSVGGLGGGGGSVHVSI